MKLFGIRTSRSGGDAVLMYFISWALAALLFSCVQTFVHFCRGYYEEIWRPTFSWSDTIYAIMKDGIMGNIHVKLHEVWTSGSGGDVV